MATKTPFGPRASARREPPGQRDLPQPEHDQVDQRRRPRVAGAVERLRQHHAIGVEHEAEADDPQAVDGVRLHVRIAGEERAIAARQNTKITPTLPRKIML